MLTRDSQPRSGKAAARPGQVAESCHDTPRTLGVSRQVSATSRVWGCPCSGPEHDPSRAEFGKITDISPKTLTGA